jgi:hypothetical protein
MCRDKPYPSGHRLVTRDLSPVTLSESRLLDPFNGFRQPFFRRAHGHADVAFV